MRPISLKGDRTDDRLKGRWVAREVSDGQVSTDEHAVCCGGSHGADGREVVRGGDGTGPVVLVTENGFARNAPAQIVGHQIANVDAPVRPPEPP